MNQITLSIQPAHCFKKQLFKTVLGVATAIALVACGSATDDDDSPLPTGVAARIAIPGDGLLVARQATTAIDAVAFDASDNPIDAPLVVVVDDPALLEVDGLSLRATGGIGQTTLHVESGDVRSADVRVVIVELQDNVTLVDDRTVIEIAGLDAATYATGAHYTAVIADLDLAPGDLVLGSGAAALAGRVDTVSAHPAGTAVELELVALTDLISDLDLALGGELVDPPSALLPTAAADGPFDCEFDSDVPAAGNPSLTGSITHDLRLDINIEVAEGELVRSDVLSVGSMDAQVTAELEMPTLASAELSCRLQLAAPRLPLGGALALLASPRVPLGIGFDVTVELAGARPATFGATGRLRAEGVWGTRFTPEGGVVDRTKVEITRRDIDFTSDVPDDTRVEVSLFAYAFATVTLGLTFDEDASLELLDAAVGLRENLDLDAPQDQGTDDEYASGHDMEVHVVIEAGGDIQRFLERFGFGAISDFALEHDIELFTSPVGSFECDDGPCINATTSQSRDGVPVTLTLDPDSLEYGGAYIVTAVRFYSADHLFGTGYELLAEIVPERDGQSEFQTTLPIVMELCRDVEAFVLTNRSPIPMEIAARSTQRIGIGDGLQSFGRDECY